MKRINLIPPEARKLSGFKRLKKFIVESYIAAFSLFLLFLFISGYIYNISLSISYRRKILSKEEKINKLEKEIVNRTRLREQRKHEAEKIAEENKYLQRRLTFLIEAKKKTVKWPEVLFVINKTTLPDMWLTKISLNREEITIKGTTTSNLKVSDFMNNLEKSGYFKSTTFTFTQKDETKTGKRVIDFEVITQLNR